VYFYAEPPGGVEGIYATPLGGGAVTPSLFIGGVAPLEVQDDHGYLYFTDFNNPTVRRATLPGGQIEELATLPAGGTLTMAQDRDHVFVSTYPQAEVWRLRKDPVNPAPLRLTDQLAPWARLAAGGGYLYWADNLGGFELVRVAAVTSACPPPCSPESVVLATSPIFSMYADGTYLYWIESGDQLEGGSTSGTIKRIAHQDPATIETLAESPGRPLTLTVFGDFLYWVDATALGADGYVTTASNANVFKYRLPR
jgi:hypothetical protein